MVLTLDPWLVWELLLALVMSLLRVLRFAKPPLKCKPGSHIIPSPRSTVLPFISAAAAAKLPYPPNIFPGSRDIDSPYGTFRVFEWGPVEGKKIVLVHGDSTPCPVFASIASLLAGKGCRILMLGEQNIFFYLGRETKTVRERADLPTKANATEVERRV